MVSSDNEGGESLCFIMIYSVVKLLNTGRTPVTTSLIDFHLGMIVAFITIHYHVASVCVPFGFCIVPPRRGSHRQTHKTKPKAGSFLLSSVHVSYGEKPVIMKTEAKRRTKKNTQTPAQHTHPHWSHHAETAQQLVLHMRHQKLSVGCRLLQTATSYSFNMNTNVTSLQHTHTHTQRKTNLSTENTFSLTQSSRPLVHINRLFSASTDDSACRRMQSGSEGTRGV